MSHADAAALADRAGVTVLHAFHYQNAVLIAYPDDSRLQLALGDSAVRGVEYGVPVFSFGQRNWGHNARPWGHGFADVTQTGSGLTVGVIDTGIDCSAPDFTEYGVPICAAGKSFVPGYPSPYQDLCGHGTMVASVIVARQNGVGVIGGARKALPAPYRVFATCDPNPDGLETFCTWVAAAVDQATYDHRDVINLSVGWADTPSNRQDCLSVEYAIAEANGAGILVVAAAGNVANGCSDVCLPAAYSGAVAVSGVLVGQFGVMFWHGSASGPEVEIAASAHSVKVSLPGGAVVNQDGTSFAAPQVAAAALVVISAYPEVRYHGPELRNHLRNTAYYTVYGNDPMLYGSGTLDAVAAVSSDPCSYQECGIVYPDPGG